MLTATLELAEPGQDPDVEGEALLALAEARGGGAEGDLSRQIDRLNGRVATLLGSYVDPRGGPKIDALVMEAGAALRERNALRERRARLRAVLHPDDVTPAPDVEDAGAELQRRVVDAAGRRGADDLRALAGRVEADLLRRVGRLGTALADLVATYRAGQHFGGSASGAWDQDAWIDRVRVVVATRRVYADRLVLLARDKGGSARVQAAIAAEAVRLAGGPERVARGVIESRRFRQRFVQEDPDYPQVERLATAAAGARSGLEKLGVTPADAEPGSYGAELAGQLAEAERAAAELKERILARQTAAVSALVGRVSAGDPEARAELIADVVGLPRAFAPGLAAGLTAADAESAALGVILDHLDEERLLANPDEARRLADRFTRGLEERLQMLTRLRE